LDCKKIANADTFQIPEAEKSMSKQAKISIPFPESRPKVSSSYMLHYAKPAHINVAGSYPLKTSTWSDDTLDLDLVVTMPQSIFQDKDYLNHRYFARRAYYIACLAAGIKADPRYKFKLNFEFLQGNQYLSVLSLEPVVNESHPHYRVLQKLRIVLLPVPSVGTFELQKLSPTRNCLRSRSTEESGGEEKPTPFYNASVLQDALVTSYLKFQHDSIQNCDQYRDACSLGRVWLKQRGLSSKIAEGGFGNFEWAVLMGLLLQGGGSKGMPVFSQGYSSYQLFKATLQYLATKDLIRNPHVIGNNDRTTNYKSTEAPVVFDFKRNHNILYRMTPWSYRMLRHEAEVTLKALGDSSFDSFETAFILRTDYDLCRYDAAIEVPMQALLALDESKAPKGAKLTREISRLYKVLTTALTTRVNLINIHGQKPDSWQVDRAPKIVRHGQKLIIGILFDGTQINRTVDHGPSADMKKDAAEFTEFWGDKAELRRFRDGRILESLVWSIKPTEGSTFHQILSYAIGKHFGVDFEKNLKYIESPGGGFFPKDVPLEHDNKTFQVLLEGFQELERTLRALEDIPLRVSQVSPADSQLSYSSIAYPLTPEKPKMLKPAEGVMQLEGSARWPDDMEAIQRTKIAFLVKMAESLEESDSSFSCQVGLENEGSLSLNQGYIDVLNGSGLAFRLRIHHDREVALLEKQLKDKSLQQQEKLEIGTALSIHKQQFLRYPAHCQAMQNLATRYPSFSQSLRLTKYWFSSHHLSSHFAEPLIEMFVAKTYTNPYPWRAPTSPVAGLLRTILLLGRWDWHSEPWIVNLGGEPMKDAEAAAINTRFEAWRKIDPAMNRVVMFAASNTDGDGTTWTDHGRPMKVVAARMTALAKAASDAIKNQGLGLDVKDLFGSNLAAFDFTIRMNHSNRGNKKHKGANGQVFKNIELQAEAGLANIGFDPFREFVTEVERLYSNALVLFYSTEQRDTIAGLWNPQTHRPWKLRLGYSSIPSAKLQQGGAKSGGDASSDEQDEEVEANKSAILNEIARLGGDMVTKIEHR
jgi:U3 small nucleolar RNA-associated protein 22